MHVWRAVLDLSPSAVHSLFGTLSGEERGRAKRFYFQKDREHFIVARGMLRAILGSYLATAPDQLRLSYGPRGKPSLASEYRGEGIEFNLAHSYGLALLAVACGRQLGVDLELIRPGVADESLAERFFSRGEVATLRALPREMQDEAFFNCWTRKEAYIKASGEGLSIPLSRFRVSLAPGAPPELLSVDDNPGEVSRWSFRELAPAPGYVAALAVEGQGGKLELWDWVWQANGTGEEKEVGSQRL